MDWTIEMPELSCIEINSQHIYTIFGLTNTIF